jgi:predicted nucleic acid-binding protein
LRYADETVLRSEDVACSESALARFDLTLRAADALHIAAACRLGAMLVTFDRRQAASATSLGVSVARL